MKCLVFYYNIFTELGKKVLYQGRSPLPIMEVMGS